MLGQYQKEKPRNYLCNNTRRKNFGQTEQDSGPNSGHKAIFKARAERDKARQPFCLVCATEQDICLVSLSPTFVQ